MRDPRAKHGLGEENHVTEQEVGQHAAGEDENSGEGGAVLEEGRGSEVSWGWIGVGFGGFRGFGKFRELGGG